MTCELSATSSRKTSLFQVFDTEKNESTPVSAIPRSGGRMAWNRDGQRLAIVTYEGAVEIWDGLKGTLLAALRAAPPPIPGEIYVENEPLRKVSDLGWDPKGDRLAFVTENTVAQVIDGHTGGVQRQFFGHTGGIKCLAWSPSGRRIATGGADGTVRLYSVETGDEVSQIVHGTGSNEISSLDWSPNGDSLVSAGFDGFVMIWDARRGHDLAEAKFLLKQLEKESNNKELLVKAARLCAKTGAASAARALVGRLQSLDAGSPEAASLGDEVETTLASLFTVE